MNMRSNVRLSSALPILLLGLLSTTNSGASEPPQRTHLAAGECAEVGLECYDAANARLLLELVLERRLRAEAAEAQLAEALGTVTVLEATVAELEARVMEAKAALDVERAKRKGWFEDHFGICLGGGAVYNPISATGDFGVAITYGWKF